VVGQGLSKRGVEQAPQVTRIQLGKQNVQRIQRQAEADRLTTINYGHALGVLFDRLEMVVKRRKAVYQKKMAAISR
jgi:hypothetical protein